MAGFDWGGNIDWGSNFAFFLANTEMSTVEGFRRKGSNPDSAGVMGLNEQNTEEHGLKGEEELIVKDGTGKEDIGQKDLGNQLTNADDLEVEGSDKGNEDDEFVNENEEENVIRCEEYKDSEKDIGKGAMGKENAKDVLMGEEDAKPNDLNESAVRQTEGGSEEHVNAKLLVETDMEKRAESDGDKGNNINKSRKRKNIKMASRDISEAVNKNTKETTGQKEIAATAGKNVDMAKNEGKTRKRRKKVPARSADEHDTKNSDINVGKNEGNKGKEMVKDIKSKGVVKNEEKDATTSRGKNRKRKRGKTKGNKILGTPEEEVVKDAEKLESAKEVRRKTRGMIFMCSSKTKKDCYRYKVLGLPDCNRDMVLKIYEGMKLFLYDFDLKLMYGIYQAAGPGGYNIEPKAFKSAFPSQVRFKVLKDCLPVPEEKFKVVIRENYYSKNKFNHQLNAAQVKKLCKLFQDSSEQHRLKPSQVAAKEEDTHVSQSRRKSSKQGKGRERDRVSGGYSECQAERVVVRDREAVAPWPAQPSLHALPTLPSATVLPPVYFHDVYGRAVERDTYRHDIYERNYTDLNVQRHQDEIEHYDPYTIRREFPVSRETLYSLGHQPAYSTVDPLCMYYSHDLQPEPDRYPSTVDPLCTYYSHDLQPEPRRYPSSVDPLRTYHSHDLQPEPYHVQPEPRHLQPEPRHLQPESHRYPLYPLYRY